MAEMKRLNLRVANKQSSNLKLISSAIKSISEKGINETTMSDVSQGAGLSQGIVNFHFKSKELLLLETLKFISNEYLQSFQNCLKKSGTNPCKRIIAIVNNDFSIKICSRDKIALWFTFFSEVKFKPAYHQICKERDLYYQKITEDIFRELIKLEKDSFGSFIFNSNNLYTENEFIKNLNATLPLEGLFYINATQEERFGTALLNVLTVKIPELSGISKSLDFLITRFGLSLFEFVFLVC